jgi:uncharacterized metal-binding protein YceD (DUF177 family)
MVQKSPSSPPLVRFVDLADLSLAGSEFDISADEKERLALARWAEVSAVSAFGGKVTLKRLARTRFCLSATLFSDIEQACVVTLEPVFSHIEREFERELQYFEGPAETGGVLTLAAGDDETPDAISDLNYDMAAPLLEEFLLAIDPYPRKAGVQFASPEDPSKKSDNPFAVLKSLTRKD